MHLTGGGVRFIRWSYHSVHASGGHYPMTKTNLWQRKLGATLGVLLTLSVLAACADNAAETPGAPALGVLESSGISDDMAPSLVQHALTLGRLPS